LTKMYYSVCIIVSLPGFISVLHPLEKMGNVGILSPWLPPTIPSTPRLKCQVQEEAGGRRADVKLLSTRSSSYLPPVKIPF